AVVAGLVAYVFREPLFHEEGVAFPLMVAATTAGACLSGLVRGGLSARRRYVATATLLAGDDAVPAVLLVGRPGSVGERVAFGIALVAGNSAAFIWYRTLRFSKDAADEPPVHSPMAVMSGLAGGSLIAQVVMTGPPVVLVAEGGTPAEVTSLFLALAVFRA